MDKYAKVYELLGENFKESPEEKDVVIVGEKSFKFPSEELAKDYQKYLKKFSKIDSELSSGKGQDFSKELLIFRTGTDDVKRVDFKDLGTALFIYDKFRDSVKYRNGLKNEVGDRNVIVKTFIDSKK